MIRTILVGVDGSTHAEAAARYAIWLAGRLQATLVGVHVVDIVSIEGSVIHDISGALGFEPYLDFSSKMRDALQERGRILLQGLVEAATAAGVRSDTILTMGIVANELTELARTADLLVIGHRGVNERFSTGLLGSTAESVIRRSPAPVFVSGMEFRPCTRPLLAYDGSVRAAAVMQCAAELCATLGLPLTVLTVQRDPAAGQRTLDEAAAYLRAYDVATTCELLTDGTVPERITAYIEEHAHDLLFIGAHGHGRLLELVLGSTTEYVLRRVRCPVFLRR